MGVGVDVSVKGLGVGDVWDKPATVTLLQVLERDIEARPGAGQNAAGAPMPEYQTRGYGDSRLVDLDRTGEMLGSIRVIKVTSRGGVIACTLRHPRAVFMNRRYPFMGLLEQEAQRALEAAEVEHAERLTRVKMATRKGGNRAAISSLKGLAGEVSGG